MGYMRALPSPFAHRSPFWWAGLGLGRPPISFGIGQTSVYAGPTGNGDEVHVGLRSAPGGTIYLQWRVNGGTVQSVLWTGAGYYPVAVSAGVASVIEIRATNFAGSSAWLSLGSITPTRYNDLVMTSQAAGPVLELEWNGEPPVYMTSELVDGKLELTWDYAALVLPSLDDDDDDDDENTGEPPPPPTDGTIELVPPQGTFTSASPARLTAHRNLFGEDQIFIVAEAVTGGQPVTYSYSITGEIILHPTAANGGIKITATEPPCRIDPVRGRIPKGQVGAGTPAPGIIHGMMRDYGKAPRLQRGPATQGFDAWRDAGNDDSDNVPCDPSLCVDPGYTGQPITVLYGAGGASFTKSVGFSAAILGTDARRMLRSAAIITVTDDLPVSGQGSPFRPTTANPVKTLTRYASSVDRSMFPRLPLVSPMPDVDEMIRKLTVWSARDVTVRPSGDRISPAAGGAPGYGSEAANIYATAALMLCLAIPDDKHKAIAERLCVIGRDVYRAYLEGARWNVQTGLGGIFAGSKLPLVMGALMLGDDAMQIAARATDYAAEDRQYVYITQADVDGFDYIPADRDMPAWQINPVQNRKARTRLSAGYYAPGKTINSKGMTVKSYEIINTEHCVGAALVGQLVPGVLDLWLNRAFHHYADRVCETTYFRDPLDIPMRGLETGSGTVPPTYTYSYAPTGPSQGWALALPDNTTNRPNDFHKAMWTAYRASNGILPPWTWS